MQLADCKLTRLGESMFAEEGNADHPQLSPVLQLQNPGGEPIRVTAGKACKGRELRKVDARRQGALVAQAGA